MSYEFSIPLPYSKKNIEKVILINKDIKKSKITNFYFSLPFNCELYTGFEQARNFSEEAAFAYWKELVEYSILKGIEVIYLLNSPRPISFSSSDFSQNIKKLDKLIKELSKIGCNKVRISNPQLISYINKQYPELDILASTSFEYKTIKEYQNFIKMFPFIKQIVPSHDINKNFKLLKNIKKQFPKQEIEIMVNEGCMGGCPLRYSHSCSINDFNFICNESLFNSDYFFTTCIEETKKDIILNMLKSTNIYPWEIEEYSKIGINKFKLVGRDSRDFESGKILDDYCLYLKGIDDFKNIESKLIRLFIHHLRNENIPYYVKDVKKFLPNIKYFVKYGHLCSSICGNECKYCYKCADSLKRELSVNTNYNGCMVKQ